MKTVIIVSKCSRVIKSNSAEVWFQFDFKGAYAGDFLSKVILKGNTKSEIIRGEEYLLYVRVISCLEGALRGEILKAKKLADCWDRS